jgi:hypothetical protein
LLLPLTGWLSGVQFSFTYAVTKSEADAAPAKESEHQKKEREEADRRARGGLQGPVGVGFFAFENSKVALVKDVNRQLNVVKWSPRGQHCVLGLLGGVGCLAACLPMCVSCGGCVELPSGRMG